MALKDILPVNLRDRHQIDSKEHSGPFLFLYSFHGLIFPLSCICFNFTLIREDHLCLYASNYIQPVEWQISPPHELTGSDEER